MQINTGESGESRGGGGGDGGVGEEEESEGLPGGKGKLQCHLINMTANKRRFTFLNRKQQINQKNKTKHQIYRISF